MTLLVFLTVIEALLFLGSVSSANKTGLFLLHSYLLASNQTTWEFNKQREIDYIRTYPPRYRPFDRGVLHNLMECLWVDRTRLRRFDLPDVDEAWSKPVPTTCLNNPVINFIC